MFPVFVYPFCPFSGCLSYFVFKETEFNFINNSNKCNRPSLLSDFSLEKSNKYHVNNCQAEEGAYHPIKAIWLQGKGKVGNIQALLKALYFKGFNCLFFFSFLLHFKCLKSLQWGLQQWESLAVAQCETPDHAVKVVTVNMGLRDILSSAGPEALATPFISTQYSPDLSSQAEGSRVTVPDTSGGTKILVGAGLSLIHNPLESASGAAG